ncbi:MAG: ribonuclease P protein component [Ghiorsea sp.]|nr:ribonuclease P protein component [Ghiorsea sp.]
MLKAVSVYLHKTDFPREFRLISKADFARMKQGKRFRILGLNFIVAPNACNHARLGFAVSTKYGNAVRRGRLKRCLRSAFRQHLIRNQGIDILVIPTPQLQSKTVSEQSIVACLNKLLIRV